MDKPKFTSGPWFISARGMGGTTISADVGGVNEHQAFLVPPKNAHLIAAAPDMYEALNRLDKMTIHATASDWDAAWDAARAALAKARGEA